MFHEEVGPLEAQFSAAHDFAAGIMVSKMVLEAIEDIASTEAAYEDIRCEFADDMQPPTEIFSQMKAAIKESEDLLKIAAACNEMFKGISA